MTPEPDQQDKPWELQVKWVVLTAVVLWILGSIALGIYLLGPKVLP